MTEELLVVKVVVGFALNNGVTVGKESLVCLLLEMMFQAVSH